MEEQRLLGSSPNSVLDGRKNRWDCCVPLTFGISRKTGLQDL
jgi:hypothetical protein